MSPLSDLLSVVVSKLSPRRERVRAREGGGSGAPFIRRAWRAGVLAGALVLGVLLMAASPAFALSTHVFSFGVASSGSGAGQLSNPQDVAVNDATGDIYVADTGNHRVEEFSSSGTFIEAWGWGVADGGASFETCTSTCQAGTSGSSPGEFKTPAFVAVDNSSGASAGDVYVADTGDDLVTKFTATGSLVSSWGVNGQLSGSTSPSGPFTSVGVTVDTSGNLWVLDGNRSRWFEFGQDGTPVASFTDPRGTDNNALGVDSNGNLYNVVGTGNLEQFSPSGSDIGDVTDDYSGVEISGFAIDPATNDIYADDQRGAGGSSLIRHYNGSTLTACIAAGDCKDADSFGSSNLSGSAAGVAFDPANGQVYVADAGNNDVAVFAPGVVPDVTTGAATGLTTTGATVTGAVNPDGTTLTDCHFDYGTTTSYGQTAPCSSTPSGPSPVAVSANLTGLTLGTVYHFRLVAANSAGSNKGGDQTFTTDGPPTVDSESSSAITSITATLQAGINPHGFDSTYHFEYGTSTDYGADVPVPDADVGSGTGDASVSQAIVGLAAGTTYHYRVVATSVFNTTTVVDGSDRTFTTPPAVSIDSESVGNVNDAAGTLHAEINPEGNDSTYRFEYGPTTSYGSTAPATPADIGSGTSDVSVSQAITGLAANTTYHYRVVVNNAATLAGGAAGPDQTFTTYAANLPSGLPDGRAYELVTPANNDNGEPFIVNGDHGGFEAAAGGGAFAFVSYYSFPGVKPNGYSYLAQRGPSGWASQDVIPPQSTNSGSLCAYATIDAYSSDMSKALLQDGYQQQLGCGTDDPPLVAGEPQGVQNLFVNDIASGTYQLVSRNPVTGPPAHAGVDGVSGDLSHVAFDEAAQLTVDAPAGGRDLYDWSSGKVSLVTELPATGTSCTGTACTAAVGSFVGGDSSIDNFGTNLAAAFHGVSSDGSRIYFTSGGNLYLRENDSTTVQVDASAPGAPGPGGGGQFQAASADGSEVFFTDRPFAGLTSDTEAGSGANLYEYDVSTGQVTDLTPSSEAQVLGVSGIADDGSYLYFVADGALTSRPNDQGNTAQSGQPNLYVWHAGTTTLIATLSGNDASDWSESLTGDPDLTARASTNGRFLAFDSTRNLTGYDNTDAATGNPDDEIFLYDAAAGKLECASCNPSGAAPTAGTAIDPPEYPGIVSATPIYLQHYVSDSGQVFFDTPDSLLPGDTNGAAPDVFSPGNATIGAPDVYEYEGEGTGSCSSDTENGGCLALISSGTDPQGAIFLDATPDGSNVFFATPQQLLPADTGNAWAIYDARVNGGFPAAPSPPQACTGDTCRPAANTPPAAPSIGSVTFTGPGDASSHTSAATTAKVRVITKSVKGSRFMLSVRVPAAGRITVTAADVKTLRRSVARAGSYRLTLALTAKAKRTMVYKRTLHLVLRVGFAPHAGKSSSASVAMTVKR